MDKKHFGDRIRELREKRKISVGELAKAVNVTPSYLSKIERSKKNPGIDVLIKIVNCLGTTLDTIFQDELNEASPFVINNNETLRALSQQLEITKEMINDVLKKSLSSEEQKTELD